MRTPEDTPTDADALLRYASILSVDHASARCIVDLDDGVQSPPLPWLAPRMGETKAWLPPSVGEQVLLLCPAGEIGSGVIIGGLQSDANPVPMDEPAPLIRFKDGAVISYDPDTHDLCFNLPESGKVTIKSPSGVLLQTDLSVEGTISATGIIASDIGASGSFTTPSGHTVDVLGGFITNIT